MKVNLLLDLLITWLRRDLVVVSVSGESMMPTLRPSDLLFCSRSRPRYGYSIVIDEQTLSSGEVARHIKRITGLAGDLRSDTRISPGFAWLEGDNRTASSDSRQWGPVALERLGAVAIAVLRSRQLIDLRPRARGPQLDFRVAVVELWRDFSRGISTRGIVRSDAFGYSLSRVHPYVPTPWEIAHQALDSIEIAPEDVFVDYGCGRGRVLVVALGYPFRRVVGIELLTQLVASARHNLRRYAPRCDIVEADATSCPLPDDVTVAFLANSFGAEALAEVINRIRESLTRQPRRLRLLTYGIAVELITPLVAEEPRVLGPRLMLYILD